MEHIPGWLLLLTAFLLGCLGGWGRSARSSRRRYMRRYIRTHRNRY